MKIVLSCFALVGLLSLGAGAGAGAGSSEVCGASVMSTAGSFFGVSIEDYSSFSCSSWSARDSNVVAVKIRHEDRVELGMAVISSDGSRVLASIVDGDEFSEGAIRSVSTKIETDQWSILGNSIVAVKTSWEGSSSPNPYSYDVLNLYTMSDGKLTKILADLMVRERVGAWDTQCEGEFIRREMRVSVGGGEQVLKDLLVSETTTESTNQLAENKCVETTGRTTKADYVLSHDGQRYVVPKQILAPFN